MEPQDRTLVFLYNRLRHETIHHLQAYIKSKKGTLAGLKGYFRKLLPEKELSKVKNVEKLVEALEEQGVIGTKDVKLLKILAEKLELQELKENVEEFDSHCSDDVTRILAEIQDSTKCFLYDNLRVETIRQLDAYIKDEKGTLAELKDRFRTSLSKLTENELEEIDTVKKFVEALEEKGVIGANKVKLLKDLAKKIGLEELEQKVGEYEDDCAGIFRRALNAAKGTSGFMWDMFKGTVIHLKTVISVKGVLLTLAGATFISIYGMDPEKLQNLQPFVDFGARVVALLRGSIVIVLKVSSISSLKRLWQSYKNGSLKEKLKKSLNEEEKLKELSQGEEIDVEVTIDEEEYHAVLWNLILLDVKGKSMKNDKSQRRHSVCCERDVPEDRRKPVDVKGVPVKGTTRKRRHSVCCERDVPEDMDVKEINRIAARWASFKKEKEIDRLCRLLIDGGTRALRDVFDSIHSPSSLHRTLLSTTVHSTLKGLRAEKILSEQQWDRLYPATKSTPVTSAHFDIAQLLVLLRNICGLTPPPTGWDKLPVATDLSREADLARIKYYGDELYGHITETAVSDSDFEKYWSEISDVLVRLGGPHYEPKIERFKIVGKWKTWFKKIKEVLHKMVKKDTAADASQDKDIERLKIEAMDPEDEKTFIALLEEREEIEKRSFRKEEELLRTIVEGNSAADASQAKGIIPMASSWASQKKENLNFARLSKLLIDGGTRVLRDVFDSIHSPSYLHRTLLSKEVHSTLNALRAEKILTNQHCNRLYPASTSTPVTSADFDIALLFVLLRNICGLTPPPTGWDKPPVSTDLSREADLARVKHYRNELYGHITETAVSDSDFEKYWSEISDVLVRLGGPHYKPEIERMKIEAMNPEVEKRFIAPLEEWEEIEKRSFRKEEELLRKRMKRDLAADASQAKGIAPMASSWASPKMENLNFARLSKLLIDGGTRALRDVFDSIHSPSSLHRTLLSTKVHSTLKGLREKRILNKRQWDRLYPSRLSTPVTSADFDITLLFVLLRNICGLTPPPTGWDKPPAATDLSREADLARVKYYRNELYGHITETAVSDSDFEKYWSEISDVLVRLGGPHYKPEIEKMKIDTIDPEEEKNFIGALEEWEEMEHGIMRKMWEIIKIAKGNSAADALQAKEYTEKLKSSIKQLNDFLLSEEEDKKIRTDDIFTSVTIQRGKKHFKEPKERRFGRRQFDGIQASSTKLKSCSEMFLCPENDDQQSTASCTTNPKSILLTGKAGIGKSLFCRKLVRDWSHNRLFEEDQENAKVPDFQFVFLLTFRQLLTKERLDLRDILNLSSLLNEHSVIDEPLMQYMIENPEKLLIILDGYDEYKPHREKITGDFETRFPNDPYEKIPVPALIAKIMKGKMLNGALVLISSRPEEAEELKKIAFDVRCDIQGFSSLKVLEYIEKYFKANESMKNKVLDHIKTNEILLSFGHIPVMCFLMCYCIKWYMTESKTTEKLPVTRTELYHQVIKVFIKKHSSSKYEEMEETKVQEILQKLAELAVNLMMENKYIFNENDMKKFNLNDEEITNLKASGLLDCCPGVKKSPFEKPPLEFTFTHLTIQEFLCAFLFVEKKQIPEKRKTSDVTFMFMAGMFSREKDEKMMEKLIENVKPGHEYDERNELLTLSCLYEYKDDGFSTRVINNLKHRYCDRDGRIGFSFITDIDFLYISYLLDIVNLINAEQTKQHAKFTQSFIVNTLYIRLSPLSASGIRMLCNSLVNISIVDELSLFSCNLDDECVKIICDMLPRTKITDLDLHGNKITDVGVKIICDMLPRTKITCLCLGYNNITDVGVKIICDMLSRTKITHLDLGGNNITNVGAQCLCSVLIRDDCRVKVLYLQGNNITRECALSLQQLIPGVRLDI